MGGVGRQTERKEGGGSGTDREDKAAVSEQGNKGGKKRQIRELLSGKGGHAPLPCLMAAEKKFLHLMRGRSFFDNTNLISPLQRKDMDCGGLSRLILLLASSSLCKFTSFWHKGGQERKGGNTELQHVQYNFL